MSGGGVGRRNTIGIVVCLSSSRAGHLGGGLGQLVRIGEALMDAGEADVGHAIVDPQHIEDCLADRLGADLGTGVEANLLLDLGDERLDLQIVKRTVLGGRLETAKELSPVERLAGSVSLQHRQRHVFDPFEGGVAPCARQALPASADDRAIVRRT